MAQFHDAPARYREAVRAAIPDYDAFQDAIAAAGASPRARRILDLGVGTGETARRCLAEHPGAELVGLDASPAMLEIAGSELGDGVDLRVGRLEDELPAGPFDLIVSALAVHHLDGRGKAGLFGRVAERLAPGGRFVMGDVILSEAPVAVPTPIDPAVDLPDRLADLEAWLAGAGLAPVVAWASRDLAVVVGSPAG